MNVESGQRGVEQPPCVRTTSGLIDPEPRASRFETLYESHYSAIYAFFFRRVGASEDEARDLTDEVFVTAWRRLGKVPGPPRDLVWLYGVARRILSRHRRSFWRRSKLLLRLKSEATIYGDGWNTSERDVTQRERVQAAIARLKPSDRDVLGLVFWEQLSQVEVASVFGCSVNAVGLKLLRAKSRLRKELLLDERSNQSNPQNTDVLPNGRGLS